MWRRSFWLTSGRSCSLLCRWAGCAVVVVLRIRFLCCCRNGIAAVVAGPARRPGVPCLPHLHTLFFVIALLCIAIDRVELRQPLTVLSCAALCRRASCRSRCMFMLSDGAAPLPPSRWAQRCSSCPRSAWCSAETCAQVRLTHACVCCCAVACYTMLCWAVLAQTALGVYESQTGLCALIVCAVLQAAASRRPGAAGRQPATLWQTCCLQRPLHKPSVAGSFTHAISYCFFSKASAHLQACPSCLALGF